MDPSKSRLLKKREQDKEAELFKKEMFERKSQQSRDKLSRVINENMNKSRKLKAQS